MDPLLERALEIANRPRANQQPNRQPSDNTMNEGITIEPAHPNARPVYWERGTREIVGPATPEFLARVGTGPNATYWVVAQFKELPVWINSTVLRSKQAFERQVKPRAITLHKEYR
jgi:hypothetical protein